MRSHVTNPDPINGSARVNFVPIVGEEMFTESSERVCVWAEGMHVIMSNVMV